MRYQKSFNKANPCPLCEGYAGAYSKEDRCKGFTTDTGVIYCQRIESPESHIFFGGLRLFKHSWLQERIKDLPLEEREYMD